MPLPQNRRLDSWKEIADYLCRDLSTVRRWEQNGLPVHRVPGGLRQAVYAYSDEIDAWLAGGGSRHLGGTGSDSHIPTVRQGQPGNGHVSETLAQVQPHRAGNRAHEDDRLLRIAVLPLENGGNTETEYLSDGVTESLIASLSQLPDVRVIARSSVFRYKGKGMEASAVGRELKVGAVLAGTLHTRGDSLAFRLELVDTRDNSFMWGAKYNRSIHDLVAVEDEIAREVANNLQSKLPAARRRHALTRSRENPEAYQLYLKGKYQCNKRTRESFSRALNYFNTAVQMDPSLAVAYAGLADTHNMLVWNMIVPSQEGAPKAKAAALRALEIEPGLADAHCAMAFMKLFCEWDWVGAEREFKITLDLNPNYSIARQWYAMQLAALGRHQEAMHQAELALDLDPLNMSINATNSLIYYHMRDFDQCVAGCLRTLELDSSFWAPHFMLGLAYEQKGEFQAAIRAFERAVELSARLPLFICALGHGLGSAGRVAEAEKCIAELQDSSEQRDLWSYSLAVIYAGLGDRERALEYLHKAASQRATWMIFLNVHPYWDRFRGEPVFQEILAELNLPA